MAFLLFAALFFAGWPLMRLGRSRRWFYLTAASFLFYGWWDWRFLMLITASGLIDFAAGLLMARLPRLKKVFLVASILGNVGSLAVFKYLDFLIINVNAIGGLLGGTWRIPATELILPIGISFYTFQSMSYTIDIYRGKLQPTRNVLHFFAYLSMFPQLVAGPIVRAADLLPQLAKQRRAGEAQRWAGLRLIAYGFFKKVVVADTIAPVVREALSGQTPLESCGYWWIVMALFAYQIYCDFSGYSDIARGLGKWMGYEFPVNFNHPYIADSFQEFWRRWHISLSTWFRDYVYIPLGGSRHGRFFAHGNMWLTMLISGLWHGAAWTFVIWAAGHAMMLSLERMTGWPKRLCARPLGRHLATLLVFVLTTILWVFFVSRSFSQAVAILTTMFNFSKLSTGWGGLISSKAINLTLLMMARQLYFHFGLDRLRWPAARPVARLIGPVGLAVLIAACVLMRGPGSTFIYFQF
ncbi:MAG: MBOAT family O-acyltransferase [Planctomycetota bacterium]|nr:MBOAT family O-acyltransferase [Planctomycetota bacterium]